MDIYSKSADFFQLNDCPRYHSWHDVPKGLRTRTQWARDHFRRVLAKEEPAGVLLYEKNCKRRVIIETAPNELGDSWEVYKKAEAVNLYSIEQTREVSPTRRTKAMKRFW